jgi:hypothetical protein
MGRGRIGAAVLALAALIASHGAWAQQAPSAGECRRAPARQLPPGCGQLSSAGDPSAAVVNRFLDSLR